jgi:hypothetical protein
LRRGRALAALALAAALLPRAAAGRPFGLGPAGEAFSPAGGFHLDARVETEDPNEAAPKAAVETPAPAAATAPPKLFDSKTLIFTASVLVAVPLLGYFAWWNTGHTGTFQFADEGWFGQTTYAGGADKASHITFSYMFTLGFQSAYRSLGKTPGQARALAFGLTVVSGLLVEIGDGLSRYGFAWEDEAANVLGASLATVVDAYGLKDTIGLRFGLVPNSIPPPCCRYYGYGKDYSDEIYAADLKLAGLLPRIGSPPGPARFFLVGVTFSSKGYRHSPPWYRQRQLGVEIGLSIPEVLRAVGVRESTWWGKALLVAFTYFRVPYTAFGWQIDLNSGRWYGPNTGGSYDPGYIIYE